MDEKWYLVLICKLSLIGSEIEYLFIYSLALQVSLLLFASLYPLPAFLCNSCLFLLPVPKVNASTTTYGHA